MSYEIQKGIFCENCIKCGKRPVSDQTKKGWVIMCENKSCKNEVHGNFLDFATWNRLNKANVTISSSDTNLKKIA